MEIIEDRHGKTFYYYYFSITNQWLVIEVIGEQTIADAILDRVVHNLHLIELKRESLRKKTNIQRE